MNHFEATKVSGNFVKGDSCTNVLFSVQENGFAFIENSFDSFEFIRFKVSIGNDIYLFSQKGNNVNINNTIQRVRNGDIYSIKKLSNEYITPVYERNDGWFTGKKTRNCPIHNGVTYDLPFLTDSFKLGLFQFSLGFVYLYEIMNKKFKTNDIRDVKIDIGSYFKIYNDEQFYRIGFVKKNGVKIDIHTPEGKIHTLPFQNNLYENVSMFIIKPNYKFVISGAKRFVIMATMTNNSYNLEPKYKNEFPNMYRDVNKEAMNTLNNICFK